VTAFVRFEVAAGTFPLQHDNVGNPADVRAGLLVVRVAYSDGSEARSSLAAISSERRTRCSKESPRRRASSTTGTARRLRLLRGTPTGPHSTSSISAHTHGGGASCPVNVREEHATLSAQHRSSGSGARARRVCRSRRCLRSAGHHIERPRGCGAGTCRAGHGGGTTTFGADLDGDGDIDGSHFGFAAVIAGDGSAQGHFTCLMAGNANFLGLRLMAVQGPVTSGAPDGRSFSGTATVKVLNAFGPGVHSIFRDIPLPSPSRRVARGLPRCS